MNEVELINNLLYQPKDLQLNYFNEIKDKINDDYYWTVLRALWIDNGICSDEWKNLFFCKRKRSHKIMKSSDRQTLKRLPKKIKAYRVCFNSDDENKWNWTLNKEFALKYQSNKSNRRFEKVYDGKRS